MLCFSCVAGSFLLLCTTAGALAAGVPFQWLPAPLVAACGLALFFDSHSLREYIVFVGGAFITGKYFQPSVASLSYRYSWICTHPDS